MQITKQNFLAGCRVLIDNGIETDEAEIVLQALCYTMFDTETEEFMMDSDKPFPCCQNCADLHDTCNESVYHKCNIHTLEHYKPKIG